MIKKRKSLFLLVLLSFPANSSELKIGYFISKPHMISGKDEAHPKGVVIEKWEVIAKILGHTIAWKKMPLIRLMNELEQNRLDGSAIFLSTPPRQAKFIFSKNHWDQLQPGIVILASSPLEKLVSADDLKPLTVGYLKGSIVTPWFKENKIKFQYLHGIDAVERLLKQVANHRIDAMFWPSLSGVEYTANKMKIKAKFKYIRSPKGPYPAYAMFPKSDAGKKLADAFDAAYVEASKKYDLQKEKKLYIEGKK